MDLVETVRNSGVVGAGGAGFLTHVKLQAKPDTILINGAECEPLLRVDQELAAAHAERLAQGLAAALEATGAKQGIFALKNKYHQAETALNQAVKAYPNMRLCLLDDRYPAGDEQVLVYETTGRVVPPGGIPPAVGVTVLNVETLYNVALASQGQPVIIKYVTVTGAVAKPATVAVPLGTNFADLLELAGGPTTSRYGLIDGGPLMGKLAGIGDVVTKTTKGIIVLPEGHSCLTTRQVPLRAQIRRAAAVCCNCRMCTDLCPRYLLGHPLEPHRSLNAAAYGLVDSAAHYTQAYLCSECGVCDTFACPMGLSPRQLHQEMKRQLAAAGVANPFRDRPAAPRREREWRRIPSARLLARLNLSAYNVPAPLREEEFQPAMVTIPLKQGAGVAAQPTVQAGAYVNRGQVIAEPPPGKLGSIHHASIDGQVVQIDQAITIKAV
ncbi:Na+-translocating ferredoxin:NAD+ oxidoreductase RnfC subunit [Hydrogenispora ethanolica]|uniref:Na+-translocating ferredoxin:NAD+ oxidoreductase RnfC subunit n=1 Tax=Hydrogenispora ethanolica TaxID=1082276 RepID=A0A4R1R7C4_HYDET|nr:4Fe-4S dicluster domain-containing protein [Hydrogenispora ethanolica]TCL61513.1 Na+-translocating ferredoxin:NAD+ oxidoreductase RnfC subunit [Hydrogenispora ethanolica]